MSLGRTGPRYLSRFACIGADCESTCCSDWSIAVDAAHYRKIQGAFGGTKEGRKTFASSVQKLGGEQPRRKTDYALIVLNPKTQGCSFLGDDKLCKLQRSFGEGMLPDVCASYPRRQSLAYGRVEVAAVLSCPEAARQALLSPDAMDLMELGPAAPVRDFWVQIAAGESLYEQSLDLFRLTMRHILLGNRFTAIGIGTIAALADELGPAFSVNGGLDDSSILAAAEHFRSPAVAAEIANALTAFEVPLEVPMGPLLDILGRRFEYPNGRIEHLLDHAVKAFAIGRTAVVAEVAAAYHARRDLVRALVEPRLDAMMKNYALNHVFTQWFTNAPSLAVWVRGLILRVALVRFLVYAHPDIAALESAATAADAERTVERVTVECVYKLSRAIEHHQPFLAMLDQVLPETLPKLEHAISMLQI